MIYSNGTIVVLDLIVANGTDVRGHHRNYRYYNVISSIVANESQGCCLLT